MILVVYVIDLIYTMIVSKELRRGWLIGTNACMMFGWMRVLIFLLLHYYNNLKVLIPSNATSFNALPPLCNDQFVPLVHIALIASFLEVFNSMTGMTRSKPAQVLLFAIIRFGVEHLVGPNLNTCPTAWSHTLTVMCWSLGDTIRFGCFFADSIVPNGIRWAKYIRYTVGPILFPLGTLGEMLMVLTMANQSYNTNKGQSLALYVAALFLWPIGFFSLFIQLLRQRQKFLQQGESIEDKKDY
jgi:Protein tyrosine phosphatase-like protein, PTPLA